MSTFNFAIHHLKVANIVQLIFIICLTEEKLLNSIEDKNNIITFAEETHVNSGIEHVKLLISLHVSVKKRELNMYKIRSKMAL